VSFQPLFDFEQALAEFTGAPYAVVTDCCTHALELCFIVDHVDLTEFTAFTYLSIPQLMNNLGIQYTLNDTEWVGEYKFEYTCIWDSARRLERNMYRYGQKQCLSFGNGKPLHIGRCGAILLDNEEDYQLLSRMRSDGRDLHQAPWQDHAVTKGYHYCPTLEDCKKGLELLPTINHQPKYHSYPDCRKLNWTSSSQTRRENETTNITNNTQ
jgi:dTDP-4-amino-4,6-dideoxygalactose transaminase